MYAVAELKTFIFFFLNNFTFFLVDMSFLPSNKREMFCAFFASGKKLIHKKSFKFSNFRIVNSLFPLNKLNAKVVLLVFIRDSYSCKNYIFNN